MTATVNPTSTVTVERTAAPALWRAGARAGLLAALATVLVAAVASGLGVSFEIADEAIPVAGFGTMTLMCVAVGTLIAAAIRRWASHPTTTWVRVAVALTAVSFVPDLTADATTGTKLSLMLTHVVAAAIVIPAIAKALATD